MIRAGSRKRKGDGRSDVREALSDAMRWLHHALKIPWFVVAAGRQGPRGPAITRPPMSTPDHVPSLLRHPSFVMFWCARTSTNGAYQMLAVAVGWQLYELTNDPLDLGILGLVQFLPLVTLAIFVGQIADRCDRRAIIRLTQVVKALAALLLAFATAGGWLTRELMFTILFGVGFARAFEMPTIHAIVPDIVPQSILPRAIAAGATAQQTAIIAGPAIGGFIYLLGANVVYVTCAVIFVTAAVLVSLV